MSMDIIKYRLLLNLFSIRNISLMMNDDDMTHLIDVNKMDYPVREKTFTNFKRKFIYIKCITT